MLFSISWGCSHGNIVSYLHVCINSHNLICMQYKYKYEGEVRVWGGVRGGVSAHIFSYKSSHNTWNGNQPLVLGNCIDFLWDQGIDHTYYLVLLIFRSLYFSKLGVTVICKRTHQGSFDVFWVVFFFCLNTFGCSCLHVFVCWLIMFPMHIHSQT